MILDHIEQAMDTFEKYEKQRETEETFIKYQRLESNLSIKQAEILSPGKAFHHIKMEFPDSKVSFPIDCAAKLIDVLSQLEDAVKTNNVDSFEEIINLFSLSEQINESLKIEWIHYINKTSGELKKSTEVLKSFITGEDQVQLIKTSHVLKKAESEWPISKTTLKEVKDVLKDGKDVLAKINLSPDVQEFLELIISPENEATLTDLTPNILDWIEEQGLQQKMIITLKP